MEHHVSGYVDGLGDAVEQGLVKAVGVSNYSGEHPHLTRSRFLPVIDKPTTKRKSRPSVFMHLPRICTERRLRDAYQRLKKRGIPLASNQVNYSLIYRLPEENGVKAACDELGITLIAYSPIAQGKSPWGKCKII